MDATFMSSIYHAQQTQLLHKNMLNMQKQLLHTQMT
jgi:hypothetical protein